MSQRNHNYRSGLMILVFVFLICSLSGAWIDNYESQLIQPDGTVIDVFLTGDEFHNWAHDAAGFTIIQDPITGYWCWARASGDDVVSTGNAVHLYAPTSLGLSPHENISEARYIEKRAAWDAEFESRDSSRSPSVGTIQNIVIFVRFSDDSEFPTQTSFYDNMFNAQGAGVNSMKQYFWDASFGQLYVNTPFFPIATGNTVVSYQSPHPRSYFQPYHATLNPNGYQNQGQRTRELISAAVAFIAPQVPTELVIDYDNDGLVDNVNFIVRGTPGAWADLLWPHMSNVQNANIMLNGKRVATYNFNIESMTNTSGVGVLSHEFGHSMGLPDFYRYNTSGYAPTGFWDLMAADRNPPQSITAHAQVRYLSWLPTIPTITESGFYTLNPLSYSQTNVAFRINSPFTTSEYFVVEYRNNTLGLIDSNLPGSGMLVYRINPSRRGNAQGPPDEVYIYRPGGTLSLDGSLNAAHFTADMGRTVINDLTNPSSFLQNGQPGGLFISHVGSPGETISFYVNIGGADPNNFNESFENQVFTDYDWVLGTVSPWYITNEHASHGSYSATSANIGHSESSRLELNLLLETGFFQFFVKTSTRQGSDYLRLYINGTEVRAWSGETNWTHYSTPLAEGLYNFAWVYQRSASGTGGDNKVWIDQVGFPNIAGHILYPPTNLSHSLDEREISFIWDTPFSTSMPNPPVLLGYNLYQNNFKINETPISTNAFVFDKAIGGNMQFWVVAEYENGESAKSNNVDIQLPYLSPFLLNVSNENGGVRVNWEFAAVTPQLLGFRVHRNGTSITMPYLGADNFTYHDTDVIDGEVYTYYIIAIFTNPSGISLPSNEREILVSDCFDEIEPVYVNELKGNYPNPFNPETTIYFTLENQSNVQLEIFNIRGALVKTLIANELERGSHNVVWHGDDNHGRSIASGVYFYRLSSDSFQTVRRMVLLK